MDPRLAALVTLVVSLVIATVLAVVVRSAAAGASRRLGTAPMKGIGRSVFTLVAVIGVIVALSVLDEEALDAIPEQALAFVPRVLGAGVLLVAGWILARLVARMLDEATSRATGRPIALASTSARWAILGAALILALGQLGIETLFLVIATTIALATVGLTLALLTVAAGRDLASNAAQGRYLRRQVTPGSRLTGEGFDGVVVEVGAATTVLDVGAGAVQHVPNARIMANPFEVRPPA